MPELFSYWLPPAPADMLLRYVNDQVAELHRAVTALGFAGVEVGSNVNGRPIGHPAFAPFFAEAAALGAAVFVHAVRPATRSRSRSTAWACCATGCRRKPDQGSNAATARACAAPPPRERASAPSPPATPCRTRWRALPHPPARHGAPAGPAGAGRRPSPGAGSPGQAGNRPVPVQFTVYRRFPCRCPTICHGHPARPRRPPWPWVP